MTTEEMRIDDVQLRDGDAERLAIEVAVTNPSQRTLHVHATPRRVQYDPATRVLAVELTDENLPTDTLSAVRPLPRFKAVDPDATTTLRIQLPRVMHRLSGDAPDGLPVIETLPIHEADEIEVRIGWSDTPFYPDPRERKAEADTDIAKWQKGLATARTQRANWKSPPDATSA